MKPSGFNETKESDRLSGRSINLVAVRHPNRGPFFRWDQFRNDEDMGRARAEVVPERHRESDDLQASPSRRFCRAAQSGRRLAIVRRSERLTAHDAAEAQPAPLTATKLLKLYDELTVDQKKRLVIAVVEMVQAAGASK
jgi:hypothetical protein